MCNRYVRNYDAVNEIQVNTHDILKMMKEMDEQTTVGSHRMTGGILREHKTVSGTSSRYYWAFLKERKCAAGLDDSKYSLI